LFPETIWSLMGFRGYLRRWHKRLTNYKNSYGYPLAWWDLSKHELWLKVIASTEISIFRVDKPASMPRALLSIPVGSAYDVYYQPQGKYLVYNKDTGGNEFYQLYLYDIAAGESKLLTDGKSRNTEPVWSNAGDKIIHSSSPPNGNGVDLSIIDPFEPRKNRLLAQRQGHYLKAYDWSPDDRRVAFCDFTSNTVSTLWVIDVATGEKTLLSQKGEAAGEYYDSPQFS
jgi:Tol biopolymer transport system component